MTAFVSKCFFAAAIILNKNYLLQIILIDRYKSNFQI